MITTILIFIAVLVVLIISHELGHFITAKLSGVAVLEFGIGFPPRLLSFKRGETIYSINLIPVGGFVKMSGEEDPSQPGSLAGKSIPTRLLVLSAGSVMNILLPIALFTMSFALPHDEFREQVLVQDVALGSPAQAAGIEKGDIILKVNDRPIDNRGAVGYNLHLYVGMDVRILLQKPDQSQKEVVLTPRWRPPPGQGLIGVVVAGQNSTVITESLPVWQALPTGIRHSWEIMALFKNEVLSWFVGSSSPQVTGPIGIAQMTGEVARAGLSPLMEFAALISLNLAIFNLFPFPGLDGGRLAFVILEAIRRGKRIPPKAENLVHLIGFAILLALIFAVTYRDITRIVTGESLIP